MKILIVDDEENARKLLRLMLKDLGHEIHEAENGIEALKCALAERPDLVILDVIMLGVDGYEICYLIKTAPELRRTRVIISTVRGEAADVLTGLGAFADAYLVKPFNRDALLATIEKLDKGERSPIPVARGTDPAPK